MSQSIRYFVVFVLILLVVQVGLQLAIKRFGGKWSGRKIGNSVLLTLPAMVTFTAIMIANSFSSSGGQAPRGIENAEPVDSIERAATRIRDLETHTAYLGNYLEYERQRQVILVTGLSAIFFVSLFMIGLGIYEPKEENY